MDGVSASIAVPPSDPRETRVATVLFVGLMLFHAWAATVGWRSLSLPGVEFRQAQTALSAQFIQREHNFSLAYPTPVLGKPWSIPMEFPLYQWTTVWLSNATGMPLTQAGRTVSLVCFYLTLPALYLLLARFGLTPARRLVVLGLVVSCPLYIHYARAFLMETMALMFGAWFLLGHVNALERRRAGWVALAALAGAGAGLVKVTTLMLFLLLALAWTLYRLGQTIRAKSAVEDFKMAAWSAATVVVPCGAAVWWVAYSDAIKLLNPLGSYLTSAALHDYNWGVGQRFALSVWRDHAAIIFREIITLPVLLGSLALWVLFSRREWRLMTMCWGFFLSVQVAFPVLYALHAYYYVANAFLLLLAVGLALVGLLESKLPRIAVWVVVGLAHAGQVGVYWRLHYPVVREWSAGGTTLTLALREVTEPESVLLIVGDDWSSIIPYHAQRRACMLPTGREYDPELRQRVFAGLAGEQVSALVLQGAQRDNRELLAAATATFGIDSRPVFSRESSTVYLRKENRQFAIQRLTDMRLPGVLLSTESTADQGSLLKREAPVAALPPLMREAFARMSPEPVRFYSTFGAGTVVTPVGVMFNAHPDTRLWFELPRGASTVSVECYLAEAAYQNTLAANEQTDGVSVSLQLQQPDGSRQPLVTRPIEPATRPTDRGLVLLEYAGMIPAGATLVIEVLPGSHGNYTRDWFSLGRIEIK